MHTSSFRLLILLSLGLLSIPAFAMSGLDPWDAEARETLALPVKIWLGLMLLNSLAALIFIRRFTAPKWVFAGWLISHGSALFLITQGFDLLVGQVSLMHIICWTPGFIALILCRDDFRTANWGYRTWALLTAFFYIVSMAFDIPDALTYLMSLDSA